MEVDLLYRHTVGMALCLGNEAVDRQHILAHTLRQVQMVPHQMGNVTQTGMAVTMRMVMVMCVLMVVIMGMFMVMLVVMLVLVVVLVLMAVVMLVLVIMAVAMIVIMFVTVLMELCALAPAAGHIVAFLFLAVHTDAQMRAGNSAFDSALPLRPNAGDTQCIELPQKPIRVRQQLQQRGSKHIAGRAHSAVQIQCFHPSALLFPSIWLIMLARYPAPKPLSILTTDTPLAQELSMESNADKPWKDAPYPTLVGTAITGQSASPPMTLARAPSMPQWR